MSMTGTQGAQGFVRPYGDTTGDGRVQVSFTLPVPFGDEAERARAEGAALQLAGKMGLDPAMVVHAKGMGPDFTFFIVYGRVSHLVDLDAVTVAEREFPVLPAAEVNLRIRSALGRKLVVVGAASAPTRIPWASTRSSTSRGTRGRRAWSTTGRSGW